MCLRLHGCVDFFCRRNIIIYLRIRGSFRGSAWRRRRERQGHCLSLEWWGRVRSVKWRREWSCCALRLKRNLNIILNIILNTCTFLGQKIGSTREQKTFFFFFNIFISFGRVWITFLILILILIYLWFLNVRRITTLVVLIRFRGIGSWGMFFREEKGEECSSSKR